MGKGRAPGGGAASKWAAVLASAGLVAVCLAVAMGTEQYQPSRHLVCPPRSRRTPTRSRFRHPARPSSGPRAGLTLIGEDSLPRLVLRARAPARRGTERVSGNLPE